MIRLIYLKRGVARRSCCVRPYAQVCIAGGIAKLMVGDTRGGHSERTAE